MKGLLEVLDDVDRQADPRSGRFVPVAVAREVNTMGPGDWFGEIGLLQRRPRTATVTVTEPVELVRVPGAVFLDGLAAPEILPDPIRRTVAARPARTHPTEVTE